MFKYHKGMIPKSVCEQFTRNSSNHSYNTRNKDTIRLAYGEHKFLYLTLDLLMFMSGNTLPVISLSILLWLISTLKELY